MVCDGTFLEAANGLAGVGASADVGVDVIGSGDDAGAAFPEQLALVLKAHGIGADAIAQQVWRMGDVAYAQILNRRVLEMLSEFSYFWRSRLGEDLMALFRRLAETP